MRIDPAYADARLCDAGLHERRVAALDRALYEARLDFADRVDDPDMRGHMNHAQLRRHQHHRYFVDARQMREHFGVAGILVAAGVQRFLVERRRADGVDLPGFRQLHRARDELIGRIARDGRQAAEGQVGRNQVEIDAVDRARLVARVGRFLDAADLRRAADDLVRSFEPARIADHERTALPINDVVCEALDDDFRADACCVAHRNADHGKVVAHDVLP